MTRRDYIRIAEALAAGRREIIGDGTPWPNPSAQVYALGGWATARDQVMVALANDNPRFNRGLFITHTHV